MRRKDQKQATRSLHRTVADALAYALTLCLLAVLCVTHSHAQDLSTGSVNVTVVDPGGAAIDGAKVVLTDLGTNEAHTVITKGAGTAVIPYLSPARYSLTITREGFSTSSYASVTVQTNQVTNINATLKVGSATESVAVVADSSPIFNTTQNTLSTTLDLKQVEDLPTAARNVFSLAFLVPGAVDDNFNNLPGGAVNTSLNGFSNITNRNKSGGFDTNLPSTINRLESIQELTVETGELDASKGGTSAMDIAFLTKSGTNKFHGQLFEDYRSEALNANSWLANNAGHHRGLLIINDFGGSIGGPILKDKAFFFASLGNYRQPQQSLITTTVAKPSALNGTYYYVNATTNAVESVNVLQVGAAAGCSTCTGNINPPDRQGSRQHPDRIELAGSRHHDDTGRPEPQPAHLLQQAVHHRALPGAAARLQRHQQVPPYRDRHRIELLLPQHRWLALSRTALFKPHLQQQKPQLPGRRRFRLEYHAQHRQRLPRGLSLRGWHL